MYGVWGRRLPKPDFYPVKIPVEKTGTTGSCLAKAHDVWDLLPIGRNPRLLKTSSVNTVKTPTSAGFGEGLMLRVPILQGFGPGCPIRG